MRALVITHYFTDGPAQELAAYLRRRGDHVTLISHPFPYCEDTRSWVERPSGGAGSGDAEIRRFVRWRGPSPLFYIKDVLLTIIWGLRGGPAFDLAIACDPLNALPAILLRAFGRTRKVVFYSIDYADRRFSSRVLNAIYHALDFIACRFSDRVWALSDRMTARRSERFRGRRLAPADTVPTGGDFEHIARRPDAEANPLHLAYLGHVRRFQGLELALELVASLRGEFPSLRLTVLGHGPILGDLKAKAVALGIADRVDFRGYIESHSEVESILARQGVGLALYEPDPTSFTYYADPNKPQIYMACGLPVLITDVPASARQIDHAGAGQLVEYSVPPVAAALRRWLADRPGYLAARRSAIAFAERRSWTRVFDAAIAALGPAR
ncbi:MAG TPA: glycosyltransferase [Verrucomicrobiae bacterium]|nr:glycosyltransferase [Verrucomicrobiae bacterium]